jgi:uncharacterized membrane protein YgdD (TMEM256/DUF423 family)
VKTSTLWIVLASALGALGVALGAFGAHALRERLAPEQLASWSTAVQYQLIHSAVLLALGLYAAATARPVALPGALFTAGILFFSGSIYLLLLTPMRWLGPVTPLGGLCFIAAWLTMLTLLRPSAP